VIEVKNIHKNFEQEVLKDISFTAEQGEIVFITGVSGIGKTTLLRVMMGLTESDQGQILGMPAKKACVFQENRLLEEQSVLRNIRLVTDIPEAFIEKSCDEILLHDVLDKKIYELSGGQKRRVAILRAMLAEADIVFMDEPLTGMDEATKKKVVSYILAKKADKTLIIVTHSKDEIDMFGVGKHVHIG
jgi:NitT/TauT family transport system ATP-binding protein